MAPARHALLTLTRPPMTRSNVMIAPIVTIVIQQMAIAQHATLEINLRDKIARLAPPTHSLPMAIPHAPHALDVRPATPFLDHA